MRWVSSVLLVAALIPVGLGIGIAQQTSDVGSLFSKLQDTSTTDAAAGQLQELAKNDSNARQYLAGHLPPLIANPPEGPIWLNSIRLAGDLKISETVPALVSLLSLPGTRGGPTTFAGALRLDDDPVGKALAEIGKPAVTAVGQLLQSGDKQTRWRAALVLSNMNSTDADQALRLHLSSETDPDVKRYVELQVEQHKEPKAP